jgi:paraquat-inducible protein B
MERTILYFDGSLKGLNPGAPVKFRGVTIGKVEQVLIRHNQTSNDYAMPVIIAIDKKVAQSKSDGNLGIGSKERLDLLISRGFRGRLDAESLVTGVLYVSLDFQANSPPPIFHQVNPEYHEIPTAPSGVQQFLDSLQRVDLPGISAKLNTLLAHLDELDIPQINSGITNVLGSAQQLVTNPDITNAITDAKVALGRAQVLINRIDNRVDPLADSVTTTLSNAQKALADLRRAIQDVSRLIGPQSSFSPDLSQALEELSNASRALADLAEFIQRNPDALLMGRKPPKK